MGGLVIAMSMTLWMLTGPAMAKKDNAAGRTDRPAPDDLLRAGWQVLSLPGRRPAEFTLADDGSIQIRADAGVGFLYRMVPGDPVDRTRLSWRWRVDKAVPATDLLQPGEDDRSLAVHLVFPVEDARLSLSEKFDLARARAFAAPMAGRVLTYVWGGRDPAGAMLDNPHLAPWGRQVVLRNDKAPLGAWVMEDVDFADDFDDAFGYRPPPPAYVVISVDSDDTDSMATGAVADLMFIAARPAGPYQP